MFDSPESVSDFPESVSDFPESVSDFPESVSDFPESVSDFPESKSDFPESKSDFPESVSDSPESKSDFPESVSDSPESKSDSPESKSDSPEYLQKKEEFRGVSDDLTLLSGKMVRRQHEPVRTAPVIKSYKYNLLRIKKRISCFMPTVEGKFSEFADNFVEATEELATTLGIPAEAVTEQKTQHTAYTAAFNACKSPNAGPIDHEECKEKRKALELVIRKLKNAYINGDPKGVVTNEIRMRFRLPSKDTTHTPVNPPTETPSFNIESGGYLQIVVRHPARPNNYSCAVLFYKLSSEPVTSHKDVATSKLLMRIKETF